MFPRSLVVSALVALVAALPAAAQEYPVKAVRIIVPNAPGGLSDILPRLLTQRLQQSSRQPWIVENRPGAGGVIGAEYVAKAAPDGYTLLLGFHGTHATLPALGARLGYDPIRDFVPVVLILTVPNVLVVHPSVPAHSVKELIALAKAKPRTFSFASQGNGSGGHMVGEQFMMATGLELVHVPYKGGGPAVMDLIGGQVSMMFDAAALALPNVRSGKVRPLAVATSERMAAAPDIPTMAEAGVPGIESGAWFGLFAPAGTPRAIVDWVNREAAATYSDPQIRDRFIAQGASFALGSPEQFAAHIRADLERWTRIVKQANIKLE
jgi:tripartite-type tricarboxylate transporter receptor subunit TctC